MLIQGDVNGDPARRRQRRSGRHQPAVLRPSGRTHRTTASTRRRVQIGSEAGHLSRGRRDDPTWRRLQVRGTPRRQRQSRPDGPGGPGSSSTGQILSIDDWANGDYPEIEQLMFDSGLSLSGSWMRTTTWRFDDPFGSHRNPVSPTWTVWQTLHGFVLCVEAGLRGSRRRVGIEPPSNNNDDKHLRRRRCRHTTVPCQYHDAAYDDSGPSISTSCQTPTTYFSASTTRWPFEAYNPRSPAQRYAEVESPVRSTYRRLLRFLRLGGMVDGHDLEHNPLGKLPGSVWSIPSEPLQVPDSLGVDHFAAFPQEWPRRLILGWCPQEVCSECGVRPSTRGR